MASLSLKSSSSSGDGNTSELLPPVPTQVVLSDEEQAGNFVGVIDQKLEPQYILNLVADGAAGAISSFIGITRDNFKGKRVLHLEYEGYVPMAEKQMLKLCKEVRERWDVKKIALYHKLGTCPVGDASVVIAVSSAHRIASIEAAHYLIDTLKGRVPIWKQEVYEGDERVWKENAEWVDGHRMMVPVEGAPHVHAGSSPAVGPVPVPDVSTSRQQHSGFAADGNTTTAGAGGGGGEGGTSGALSSTTTSTGGK